MFDDADLDRPVTEDNKKSSVTLERWAHFPAMLVLGILMLLFHRSPWGWQISITGSYTVYVFWFALGNDKQSFDDIAGDTLLFRKIASQLLPHLFILVLVVAGVTEWFRLLPILPPGLTDEGRKGSLWDMFGWLALGCSGIAQGFWMSARIKRQFPEPDD
jgi:hypothetical protein